MDKALPVSVWPEWEITEKIGEGSFGKVYKAQRTEKGKTFYSAIKIITIPSSQSELNSIRSETSNEQSAREYFQNLMEECIQEVSTMEYFRGNSHIVSVEDYKVVEYLDTIGWDIFIRMEYLTSFLDYCAENQITEKEAIQLGIDMCKALECCQKLNIIHRDIKPENIFVSRFGEFKLGDFGIARELERTMSGMSKKGTYSYMAPEMYRGEQYDGRVDIYSLGIVLYKLCNRNRLPFLNLDKQLITYRDKENALTRRMSGEPLPAPAQAGELLAQVIQKACAYDPKDRFQDAAAFRSALEAIKYGKAADAQEAKEEAVKELPPADSFAEKTIIQDGYRKAQESPLELLKRAEEEDRRAEERRREELRRTSAAAQQNRKKRQQQRRSPLLAAVILMAAAVLILAVIFVRMLLEDPNTEGLGEGYDFVSMNSQSEGGSESSEFEKAMQKISEQATEISQHLEENTFMENGSVEEGEIAYIDGNGRVMKVLVYPIASDEGVYEEYYYWENEAGEQELFFAYIWSTEEDAQLYYYVDGKLIRWIDENKVCHDNETDNSEYTERGERYWNKAEELIEGMNPPADTQQ
ncbi:MAG TPA: serine/threonine protein kinase [Candidatus Blautia faecigallinarum]|uniref:Serine/threonine protein kinase n=1 Tax=Candidatus Blautia faecigallinarum TaxID=2838488 RepID=A0A9D2DSZ3_9FIRM|nr:serine/threonine protein kinase [Candidatus Blautia faecigallinarum]